MSPPVPHLPCLLPPPPSAPPSREIFSVLDLMKMDMANFAVSYIRPHLMKQSVEYERSKFQEFLDRHPSEGSLSLLLRCSENPPSPTHIPHRRESVQPL